MSFLSCFTCHAKKNIASQIDHHLSVNISQLTKWFIEPSYCFEHIKMFIYFVALILTPLIIFGLVHARCLNNWLRSKARNSLTICSGLIRRPRMETLTINEDTENVCAPERFFDTAEEVAESETQPAPRSLFDSKEESRTDFLTGIPETEGKLNNLNPPTYSFENVLPEARERDFELSGTRAKKDNLIESLKSTIEKSTNPSGRLNTAQIYNLILEETIKENVARQKLLETERRRVNNITAPLNITEEAPSSSENVSEHDGESSENLQRSNI
ncbi:uncharacterized protein LOC143214531 [Lasioglossum baleicum]|uniref:uncharacterized protein LOC143214531 n=1 Tax=Lasioglossum baleicum TaxID=434251 RepID=UPI003FCE8FE4